MPLFTIYSCGAVNKVIQCTSDHQVTDNPVNKGYLCSFVHQNSLNSVNNSKISRFVHRKSPQQVNNSKISRFVHRKTPGKMNKVNNYSPHLPYTSSINAIRSSKSAISRSFNGLCILSHVKKKLSPRRKPCLL